MPQETPTLADTIRAAAHPLTGSDHDYDALLEQIGEARVVLLGSAHETDKIGR